MIFKQLLPEEINYTARIYNKKEIIESEVKELEYADECLIIKSRSNNNN